METFNPQFDAAIEKMYRYCRMCREVSVLLNPIPIDSITGDEFMQSAKYMIRDQMLLCRYTYCSDPCIVLGGVVFVTSNNGPSAIRNIDVASNKTPLTRRSGKSAAGIDVEMLFTTLDEADTMVFNAGLVWLSDPRVYFEDANCIKQLQASFHRKAPLPAE